MRHRLPLICFLLFVVPTLTSTAQSKWAGTADESLRGLRAVTVVIDSIGTSYPVGMTSKVPSTERIQEYIERRLRSAGISIVSAGGQNQAGPPPSLHFSLDTVTDAQGYNYYSSRLRLIEEVVLQRAPSLKVNATTWDGGGTGNGDGPRFFEGLICKNVTRFIRAYTEVNAESPQQVRPAIDTTFQEEVWPCFFGFGK